MIGAVRRPFVLSCVTCAYAHECLCARLLARFCWFLFVCLLDFVPFFFSAVDCCFDLLLRWFFIVGVASLDVHPIPIY